MKIEETLKIHIIERYGSVRAFALKADIAYTTVVTILQRGINNASLTSVKKICDALNISPDKLSEGEIVFKTDLGEFIEIKEPRVDLNELVSQYKWTMKNYPVELDGQVLTERDIDTLETAIDISLKMIKQNTRS